MTRETFEEELGRMSVLPGMPADVDGYWEALQDVPETIFVSAIGHALKTRKWFPVPVELRQDADAVRPRQVYRFPQPVQKPKGKPRVEVIPNPFGGKGITVTVTDDDSYDCAVCSDTGWEPFWCGPKTVTTKAWHEQEFCGRREEHLPHEWVRKCGCWSTNLSLLRKREAQSSYAAQRTEQKR